MASKVLGPYVAAHPRPRDAARALMAWSALPADAATPWMRRAGLTSFVNLVEGDGGLLGDGGSPSPRTRHTSPPSSSRARGGDDLFGDGFVLELASACGAALGAGGSRVPTSSFSPQDRDPGETADPTGDPEAWVRVGARWMLSLCVRECDRAEKERRVFDDEDERGRRRDAGEVADADEGEEQEAARRDPVRKPTARVTTGNGGRRRDDDATGLGARDVVVIGIVMLVRVRGAFISRVIVRRGTGARLGAHPSRRRAWRGWIREQRG